MPDKVSFTLLATGGLDHYGLTQICFESEGYYYYYRCKFGSCFLQKFRNKTDLDDLENSLAEANLESELANNDGYCDVYPHAHYIIIGKLLAELEK
jgi:hypothetical protein